MGGFEVSSACLDVEPRFVMEHVKSSRITDPAKGRLPQSVVAAKAPAEVLPSLQSPKSLVLSDESTK